MIPAAVVVEAWSKRLLHAVAHPLRGHIIEILTVDGESSVQYLAQAVERSAATVRRHLRVLEDADAVERLRGERGATTFRTTSRYFFRDEEWAQLPVRLRRTLTSANLARIAGHVRSAVQSGGFDRVDSHLSWVATSLDEVAYEKVATLLNEALDQTTLLQAESDARRPDGVERPDELRTEVVMLHFVRAPGLQDEKPPLEDSTADRDRMYELLEALDDQLPRGAVDWDRIATIVRELNGLLDQRQRCGDEPRFV
ncbi:MAG TPA: helix-turn-helix domain-containing protein [Solirubrobacteraceae bacterium]